MRKKIETEIKVCDLCGSDDCVFYECAGCGKHFCYECDKNKHTGKKYPHGVYFSGSGDVYLCIFCMANPTLMVAEIIEAYQTILRLRAESVAWDKDFRKRTDEAEAEAKAVADKYNHIKLAIAKAKEK